MLSTPPIPPEEEEEESRQWQSIVSVGVRARDFRAYNYLIEATFYFILNSKGKSTKWSRGRSTFQCACVSVCVGKVLIYIFVTFYYDFVLLLLQYDE